MTTNKTPTPPTYRGTARPIAKGDRVTYPSLVDVGVTVSAKVSRVDDALCTVIPDGMNAPFSIWTETLVPAEPCCEPTCGGELEDGRVVVEDACNDECCARFLAGREDVRFNAAAEAV